MLSPGSRAGQLLTHGRRESKTAGAMATPLDELRGASRPMVELRTEVARLLAHQKSARRLPPVLILGETGTGKGLLARCIHQAGPRRDGPFVAINCAAIPETAARGRAVRLRARAPSPTRGRRSRASSRPPTAGRCSWTRSACFRRALQGKLLTVLEDRAVRRLGGTRAEPVDVAVVAATSDDLKRAVGERALPRGPLPSPRRHHAHAAAAARARRRHARPGRALPGARVR